MSEHAWPCGHSGAEAGYAVDGCEKCGKSAWQFARERHAATVQIISVEGDERYEPGDYITDSKTGERFDVRPA